MYLEYVAFTLYPLFQWYPQSKEILLNLSMKCWNSVFNAQGSRVIIVVVQVGALKIFVAAVEARSGQRKDRMKLSLFLQWLQRHIYLTQFPPQFSLQTTGRLYENCKKLADARP